MSHCLDVAPVHAPEIVLISDPGPDPDDVKTLLVLAIAHRQGGVRLRAVVANGGHQATERAALTRRVLVQTQVLDVPVGVGSAGQPYAPRAHEYALGGRIASDGPVADVLVDGATLLRETIAAARPGSLTFVCISSLRDLADLIAADGDAFVRKVCRVAIQAGIERSAAAPYGWAPNSSVNNGFDLRAASAVYDFCFARNVPMVVTSRDAVPMLPMQLAKSFAERTRAPLLKYLAAAQFLGLEGLWRRLCAGKLPARCTKQWYFETFCGVDAECFDARNLEALGGDVDIRRHLNGFVKPYDVVALMGVLSGCTAWFPPAERVGPHVLRLRAEHAVDTRAVVQLLRDTYHEVALCEAARGGLVDTPYQRARRSATARLRAPVSLLQDERASADDDASEPRRDGGGGARGSASSSMSLSVEASAELARVCSELVKAPNGLSDAAALRSSIVNARIRRMAEACAATHSRRPSEFVRMDGAPPAVQQAARRVSAPSMMRPYLSLLGLAPSAPCATTPLVRTTCRTQPLTATPANPAAVSPRLRACAPIDALRTRCRSFDATLSARAARRALEAEADEAAAPLELPPPSIGPPSLDAEPLLAARDRARTRVDADADAVAVAVAAAQAAQLTRVRIESDASLSAAGEADDDDDDDEGEDEDEGGSEGDDEEEEGSQAGDAPMLIAPAALELLITVALTEAERPARAARRAAAAVSLVGLAAAAALLACDAVGATGMRDGGLLALGGRVCAFQLGLPAALFAVRPAGRARAEARVGLAALCVWAAVCAGLALAAALGGAAAVRSAVHAAEAAAALVGARRLGAALGAARGAESAGRALVGVGRWMLKARALGALGGALGALLVARATVAQPAQCAALDAAALSARARWAPLALAYAEAAVACACALALGATRSDAWARRALELLVRSPPPEAIAFLAPLIVAGAGDGAANARAAAAVDDGLSAFRALRCTPAAVLALRARTPMRRQLGEPVRRRSAPSSYSSSSLAETGARAVELCVGARPRPPSPQQPRAAQPAAALACSSAGARSSRRRMTLPLTAAELAAALLGDGGGRGGAPESEAEAEAAMGSSSDSSDDAAPQPPPTAAEPPRGGGEGADAGAGVGAGADGSALRRRRVADSNRRLSRRARDGAAVAAAAAAALPPRPVEAPLPELRPGSAVDFYVVHAACCDSPQLAWDALERWAEGHAAAHGGVAPTIWIDLLCADASASAEVRLRRTPVVMSRARALLVLWGPSLVDQMQCVLELVLWLAFGGELDAVTVLPVCGSSASREELVASVDAFALMYTRAHDEHIEAVLIEAFRLANVARVNESIRAFLPTVVSALSGEWA